MKILRLMAYIISFLIGFIEIFSLQVLFHAAHLESRYLLVALFFSFSGISGEIVIYKRTRNHAHWNICLIMFSLGAIVWIFKNLIISYPILVILELLFILCMYIGHWLADTSFFKTASK